MGLKEIWCEIIGKALKILFQFSVEKLLKEVQQDIVLDKISLKDHEDLKKDIISSKIKRRDRSLLNNKNDKSTSPQNSGKKKRKNFEVKKTGNLNTVFVSEGWLVVLHDLRVSLD